MNHFNHRNFIKPYSGVTVVPETEQQDKSSDSEDDIPVARSLRPKKMCSLTYQKIAEYKEGPLGERAIIGVIMAKMFDGVKFRGQVNKFRTTRKDFYHVTYTDGDEEELSQTELRDAFLLVSSEELKAERIYSIN
jgi:hypothetical protein